MKGIARNVLAAVGKGRVVSALHTFNAALRRLAMLSHHAQHRLEWGLPPTPENYDHHLNVYWLWPAKADLLLLERGVFGATAIREGSRVLDLCCGTGFLSRHFYASRAASILAIDIDDEALAFAQKRNAAPTIRYEHCDITQTLPDGPFDVVLWDAAIEHFSLEQQHAITRRICERLKPEGILGGYTVAPWEEGEQSPYHQHEFSDVADLKAFLGNYFRRVRVFTTPHPMRHNLYWWASDGAVPFDDGWAPSSTSS